MSRDMIYEYKMKNVKEIIRDDDYPTNMFVMFLYKIVFTNGNSLLCNKYTIDPKKGMIKVYKAIISCKDSKLLSTIDEN